MREATLCEKLVTVWAEPLWLPAAILGLGLT